MFGIFRIYLAVAVMAYHLIRIPAIGKFAVFSFFVLSGYLMTMIMANTYGYSARGIVAYFTNRFLRLYPLYWVVCLLSILILLYTGDAFARSYKSQLYIPDSPIAWINNISMIFPTLFPYNVVPRLSPPTWALTVEIVYYILIGFGATRTPMISMAFLCISLLYHVVCYTFHLPPEYHYGAIMAGSLPFAVGGLSFHYRARFYARITSALPASGWLGVHVATMAAAAVLLHMMNTPHVEFATLVGATIITACTIVSLDREGLGGVRRTLDSALGKFSYPIYLLHWQIGLFTAFQFFGRPMVGHSLRSLLWFAITLALTMAISWIATVSLDPAIETMRSVIKNNRARAQARRATTPAAEAHAEKPVSLATE